MSIDAFPARRVASRRGYTLLEMAIALLIVGLLLTAALRIALPMLREAQLVGTRGKMDRVAKAIDYYAVHNNRVPCPAQPLLTAAGPSFGYEVGSGAAGDQVPDGCGGVGAAAQNFGIVPFRTLGIPVDWVKDAWGNYLTYAVTSSYARNPVTIDQNAAFTVHARCRTAGWFESPMTYEPQPVPSGTPIYVSKNPHKAYFCCSGDTGPGFASDLDVHDVNNVSDLPNVSRKTSPHATTAGSQSYATVGTPYPETTVAPIAIVPNGIVNDNDRSTAIAYVLVSHGQNGFGAWNVNTGARLPLLQATPDETANAGTGGIFYEIPPLDRTTGAGEQTNDDLVVWRTPDLIFADEGESCSVP